MLLRSNTWGHLLRFLTIRKLLVLLNTKHCLWSFYHNFYPLPATINSGSSSAYSHLQRVGGGQVVRKFTWSFSSDEANKTVIVNLWYLENQINLDFPSKGKRVINLSGEGGDYLWWKRFHRKEPINFNTSWQHATCNLRCWPYIEWKMIHLPGRCDSLKHLSL